MADEFDEDEEELFLLAAADQLEAEHRRKAELLEAEQRRNAAAALNDAAEPTRVSSRPLPYVARNIQHAAGPTPQVFYNPSARSRGVANEMPTKEKVATKQTKLPWGSQQRTCDSAPPKEKAPTTKQTTLPWAQGRSGESGMGTGLTQLSQISGNGMNHDSVRGLHRERAASLLIPPQARDYQREIIASAVLENTLVSLPTGTGKTMIAAVLMQNFLRWFPG
eukprot:1320183-Rhodomonas_salina.2